MRVEEFQKLLDTQLEVFTTSWQNALKGETPGRDEYSVDLSYEEWFKRLSQFVGGGRKHYES
jgi:hypothetical protein